jgi:uracil-DNA glycosylase family 4
LEPRQTPTEGPAPELQHPQSELLRLVRSVRAHVEHLESTGAWGLPGASRTPAAEVSPSAAAGLAAPTAPAGRAAASPSSSPFPLGAAPSAASASFGVPAVVHPPPPAEGARDAEERDPLAPHPSPSRVVHLPQATTERLAALAMEASTCTKCGLHEGRHQSVFARGSAASGLVFIGEGPGEEEDRQGLPFVGPAGQLLDRMIAAMQLERDDVYVCNIVKCRPPKNRKPDPEEMSRCMPYLAEQLSLLEPRVIVALGATAVQGLLGSTEGITRLRGQWKLYRGKIPVMPTFHPAYLLRTPTAKREVWKDLQEVLRHLNSGMPRPGS